MKFRALMQDPEYMKEFQSIILTLSKLTKECVVDISQDKMYFIANEESGSIAPMVWVEIECKLYFPEFELELQDENHPHLMLAISPANLCRALTHLRSNARICKINLIKIQFSCLRIEIDVPSQSSNLTKSVHDVPVSIIPRSDWCYYEVPQKPQPKLILNVPSSRLVRGLIDKLKNLSPTITFNATSKGEMNLVAETEMATITTHYKQLEIKEVSSSATTNGTVEEVETTCSVDCKKTSLFFTALQVPTLELSCGLDDHYIHMEVDVRPGVTIHSILPSVCI